MPPTPSTMASYESDRFPDGTCVLPQELVALEVRLVRQRNRPEKLPGLFVDGAGADVIVVRVPGELGQLGVESMRFQDIPRSAHDWKREECIVRADPHCNGGLAGGMLNHRV